MKVALRIVQSRLSRRRNGSLEDGNNAVSYDEPVLTMINDERREPEDHDRNHQEQDGGDENLGLLFALAKSWAWPALTHRCKTHPWEAEAVNKDGDTALHFCVFGNPPLASVQALLDACPNLAEMKNCNGQLPLHLACCYRASLEVLQALLDASPKTAKTRDSTGFYPIHLLCDRGCRPACLKVFLQYPDAAQTVKTKDRVFGRTPLYILNQRKNLGSFVERVEELRTARQKERDLISCGNWMETDKIWLRNKVVAAKEMEFWVKARALIMAEYSYYEKGIRNISERDYLSDQGNTIEACLGIEDCPVSLIEYALCVYNEELIEPNSDGNLPLHQICANIFESNEQRLLLLEVLAARPEAAKIPDRNGRLALEIFIENSSPSCWSEIIRRLILAYPVGLDSLDIDRRLYPLIMERVGCSKQTWNEIFDLLRGVPSVFSS